MRHPAFMLAVLAAMGGLGAPIEEAPRPRPPCAAHDWGDWRLRGVTIAVRHCRQCDAYQQRQMTDDEVTEQHRWAAEREEARREADREQQRRRAEERDYLVRLQADLAKVSPVIATTPAPTTPPLTGVCPTDANHITRGRKHCPVCGTRCRPKGKKR